MLLLGILDAALTEGVLGTNPARIRGAAQVPETDRVPPTIAEVRALASAMPERLRAFILVGAFVGLRLGELQALRRRHIDIEARTIRVVEAVNEVNGQLSVGPPKSRAGVRTVDVPATICAGLALRLETFVGQNHDALVFAASTGAYLRRRNIYQAFYPARTAVGLPHLHLHDLRHLAGTLGALSGATTREQQQRLGHASPAAALRYQHVVDGRGRAVADGIDRLLRAEELLASDRPSR